MTAVGYFERRARERALREALWRSVWIQAHAFDKRLCLGLSEASREEVFMSAVEDQTELVQGEAAVLGFRGDQSWLRPS